MKAMKVGYPVVAMIAELMPTRQLYHMACKALKITPQVRVENKRYVSYDPVYNTHMIEGFGHPFNNSHSIDGPATVRDSGEYYWVDGEFIGHRRPGDTRVIRYTYDPFPDFEMAFEARAEVNPRIRLWKNYYDQRKRARELQERENERRKRYKLN